MKNTDNNKLLFYIGIPVIFLLIILRFGITYIRSDGFNGLSLILPIQLLCVIIFAFCSLVMTVFLPSGLEGVVPVLLGLNISL